MHNIDRTTNEYEFNEFEFEGEGEFEFEGKHNAVFIQLFLYWGK